MITVQLTEEEWNRVINAMALAPYSQVAPLLEKIAKQLVDSKKVATPDQSQA
jgi:hypothetical protein